MAGQFHISGRSHYEATRSSRVFDKGRLCISEDCEVTLSKYNPSEKCYLHSPKKAGRVRGLKNPLSDK